MHLKRVALFALMLALPWALHAQAIPNGPATTDEIPRYELGLNYNYFHANAPPGQCGCFSLNGGSGTVVITVRLSVDLPVLGARTVVASARAGRLPAATP